MKNGFYSFLLLKNHFKSYKSTFSIVIILAFFTSIFESLGIAAFLPVFSSIAGEDKSSSAINQIIQKALNILSIDMNFLNLAVIIILFFIFKAFFVYYSETYIVKFSNIYMVNQINSLYDVFYRTKWSYFIEQNKGFLIDYILTVTSRNGALITNLGLFIASFLALIVYLVFSFIISVKITLMAILIVIFPIIIYRKIVQIIKYHGQKLIKAGNELSKYVEQFLVGAKTIRAFRIIDETKEIIDDTSKKRMYHYVATYKWRIGYKVLLELLISAAMTIFLIVYIKIYGFSFSELLIVIIFLTRTFQKISSIQMIGNIASNIPGIQIVEKVQREFSDNSENTDIQNEIDFNESIEATDIEYYYSRKNKKIKILKKLSFSINKGSMFGIVGRSGAGKTTLIDILMGLLIPNDGVIKVDKTTLQKNNIKSWQNKIGYVPQDGFLLNDTIYNNIMFFRKLDEKDILKAAKLANCSEFIKNSIDGINTVVGDNGIKLSGGQKQRICLARALAGNPQILILDEATSSLDSHSEIIFKEAIDGLKNSITVIVIAHKLSLIMNSEQIIVMEKGCIAEKGSPNELLNKDNGLFRSFYMEQFKESNI